MRRCAALLSDVLCADVGQAVLQAGVLQKKQAKRRPPVPLQSGGSAAYYDELAAVARHASGVKDVRREAFAAVMNSEGRPPPLQVSVDAASLGILLNDYCVSRLLFAVLEMLRDRALELRGALLRDQAVALHQHARESHVVGVQSHQALLLCACIAHDAPTAAEAFRTAGRHTTVQMYNALLSTYRNARQYEKAEELWAAHPAPNSVAYRLRLQCLAAGGAPQEAVVAALHELLDHPDGLEVTERHFEAALDGVHDVRTLQTVGALARAAGVTRSHPMAARTMAVLLANGRVDLAEAYARKVPTITADVHLALYSHRPGLPWLRAALEQAQLIDPPPTQGAPAPRASALAWTWHDDPPEGLRPLHSAPLETVRTLIPAPPPVQSAPAATEAAARDEAAAAVRGVPEAQAPLKVPPDAPAGAARGAGPAVGEAEPGLALRPTDPCPPAVDTDAPLMHRLSGMVNAECGNECQEKRLAALVMLGSMGAVSTAAAAPTIAAASAGVALGAVAYKALAGGGALNDAAEVPRSLMRDGMCCYDGEAAAVLPLLLAMPGAVSTHEAGVFTISLSPPPTLPAERVHRVAVNPSSAVSIAAALERVGRAPFTVERTAAQVAAERFLVTVRWVTEGEDDDAAG
eukprot:TRINITY_DN33294_c0_g1_i1.p1 TRINITY_DN33294_c0_g1~~TRINITY_DN33294_c0_g1_i1.p1  ORF type:complete len:634 (+),score=167.47 TRINITY_DN33294_c0_g1_i1:99-2000(+)